MTSTCLACRRRDTPDEHHLCPLCVGDLRDWLAEIPDQARLLAEFVAPGGRQPAGRHGGTGRAHAPAPVDLRVLTLLGPGRYDPVPGSDDDGTAPLLAVLDAWAGHIAYHHPAVTRDPHGTAHVRPCEQAWPAAGATVTGWCAWLTAYLPYALTLPVAGDLHRQIGDLVQRLRGLTHSAPRDHPQAAPCPRCDTFALVRTDGQWGIRCRACGHHLEPAAYDEHAAAFLHTHQTTTAHGTAA
ncbi:hypothetical protein AB0G64_09340 [Streptomyces longwoodensis]|uniref:hypothetical protein n=1 Tax=Streptomyces longwoodensis TaxID=68231 RepID=UPI0033E8C35A